MTGTINEIANSIAPCGFICALCVKARQDGCRGCGTNGEICPILDCCKRRGIKGCWACADFPCCECSSFRSVRIRAFLQCAREEGTEKLSEYLAANEKRGLRYHYGYTFQGDYDGFRSVEEVLAVLRTGKKPGYHIQAGNFTVRAE